MPRRSARIESFTTYRDVVRVHLSVHVRVHVRRRGERGEEVVNEGGRDGKGNAQGIRWTPGLFTSQLLSPSPHWDQHGFWVETKVPRIFFPSGRGKFLPNFKTVLLKVS